MFVPIDNLYNWISGIASDTIIYRFYPHGSKNLGDLDQIDSKLSTWPLYDLMHAVPIICHDQEPLDYNNYCNLDWQKLQELCVGTWGNAKPEYQSKYATQQFWEYRSKLNLSSVLSINACDKHILLHSEQNSPEVKKYTDHGYVPAYWWAHAVIARDWYRFAKYDHRLKYNPDYKYLFNVYSRAWSGSREYRLKLLELMSQCDLIKQARITFDSNDQGLHYSKHNYKNPRLAVTDSLEHVPTGFVSSCRSADYTVEHYQDCAIDLVLETLFDDQRLHLTEKILRPIACGKPFIIAGTSGSLAYLQSYGFKTFSNLIDESYDTIADPVYRLQAIISVMKTISQLSKKHQQHLLTCMQEVCDYNQQHFFSDKFAERVKDELWTNVLSAKQIIKENHQTGKLLRELRQTRGLRKNSELINYYNTPRPEMARVLRDCRQRRSINPSQSSSNV